MLPLGLMGFRPPQTQGVGGQNPNTAKTLFRKKVIFEKKGVEIFFAFLFPKNLSTVSIPNQCHYFKSISSLFFNVNLKICYV